MKHIISVLVENEAGVLSRVSGLFSARGFNIESLSVAPVGDKQSSRITLVTGGDGPIIEQILKQLNKLIPVIQVVNLSDGPHVGRELMLIKVTTDRGANDKSAREEIMQIVSIFRAQVVDATPTSLIIEVTGDNDKLHACLAMLEPYGIADVVRTGQVALARGNRK
ncbi:acetolactate synthase small subunit [Candidatus Magnetaquicoccus inordinatus]|uniref:acetolactate synthase small subunit n=1 Tax=Candidatus Magnetaquicoccus inordinatus TaxID=2496818 RepID=UPI00102AF6D0|nr:acetolactate synthase small subunit [Candidatus Magnetaquicoccus inordinatus]